MFILPLSSNLMPELNTQPKRTIISFQVGLEKCNVYMAVSKKLLVGKKIPNLLNLVHFLEVFFLYKLPHIHVANEVLELARG